ncbi:DUF6503 family protein [uncultured Winogradskyella sp.]|uniref:DUF6503 family protein n=1 Tax=uncultured Winogradskyella sp. TaxID=395353 RepID=UPI0035158695
MQHMRLLFLVILGVTLFNCKDESASKNDSPLTAEEIVDEAIEVSGGNAFSNSVIHFDFRDISYSAIRNKGLFRLERHFKNDSKDSIRDVLSNEGFKRYVNGNQIILPDSLAALYAASVNSVHYFSVLPYGLNDEAVNKTLVGEEVIKDKLYYKIKVTFDENGGGEDYEDVFIYWINKNNFEMDYFAYSYNEPDGKGLRFREAYDLKYLKGLRFANYRNYKPNLSDTSLLNLDRAFKNDELDLVSIIELKNISVTLF